MDDDFKSSRRFLTLNVDNCIQLFERNEKSKDKHQRNVCDCAIVQWNGKQMCDEIEMPFVNYYGSI